MRFYGRQNELAALHRALTIVRTQSSQLISVLGRRRVGKTTLIAKAFENADIPVFSFFVQDWREEVMAKAWRDEVASVYRPEFLPDANTIADVISFTMNLTKDKPCVFIIDECQDLSRRAEGFWRALQTVWDQKKHSSHMLLVMSGSIISAMEEIFGDYSQPMYGRTDCRIDVRPFTPSVIQSILRDENPLASAVDMLTVYAVTGGVAAYLERLAARQALSAEGILDYLYSIDGEWLRSEGNVSLANEFQRKTAVYKDILYAIAQGATKWNQIQDRVNENINSYLRRLCTFGLIEQYYPILETESARRARYRIVDPYMRFWLEFIAPVRMSDLAAYQNWALLKEITRRGLPQFLGRTLELWYRASFLESGQWTGVGAWWDDKGQNEIDLVAVNELEGKLFFGEAKLNPAKYNALELERRKELFLQKHRKYANFSVQTAGLFPQAPA